MPTIFEWDAEKAKLNEKKHGVTFELARTVFGDPLAAIFADEDHSDFEEREFIIGHAATGELLIVWFVVKEKDLVRIISARKPTRWERKDYEEAN